MEADIKATNSSIPPRLSQTLKRKLRVIFILEAMRISLVSLFGKRKATQQSFTNGVKLRRWTTQHQSTKLVVAIF